MPSRPLVTLRRRKDIDLLFATGTRLRLPSLTVVAAKSPDGTTRYLFVASRRLGKAVARNRVRRRLRALVQKLQPGLRPGWWLAFLARQDVKRAAFDDLVSQVSGGLRRVGALGR